MVWPKIFQHVLPTMMKIDMRPKAQWYRMISRAIMFARTAVPYKNTFQLGMLP